MATIYKTLTDNDKTTTKTLLHEAIPLTGSIVSGTYADAGTEPNIKNYSHGMFQSVYDYPYLSSSANQIFDITCGYSTGSSLSSSANTQNDKKLNIYNQMAQVLMGYDQNGKIREFDEDGDLTGGRKMKEVFFVNFSRLLTKDEIKKGSFSLELGVSGSENFLYDGGTHNTRIKLTDASGSAGYFVNSPAGEYGVLFATSSYTTIGADGIGYGTAEGSGSLKAGLIFYQAGVVVLSASIFNLYGDALESATPNGILHQSVNGRLSDNLWGSPVLTTATPVATSSADMLFTGSTIQETAHALRNRIYNLSFNNTTELNSAIYFCRVNHNDFNYSANTTYLTGSKIRVKENTLDSSVSYITTVGLYSPNNELMAVAKLSEPLKKTPESEVTIRVRLDY